MSRIVCVDAVIASENEEGIVLRVTIANLTAKTIAGIDAGVQVVDVRGGRRIGLQELHVDRTVRPHVRMTLVEPRRYATFGEDAGSMRLALGRPKRVWIDVLGVRYAGQHEGDAD